MVYFEDLGTTIDIPFDQLDGFLDSPEHGAAHADDVRNFEVVETHGSTIVLPFERKFEGRWGTSSSRIASFPPYCVCVEEIAGVFAGSRFVGIRRPDGSATRVEVFGDVRCEGRTPEELRALYLGILAKSHEEDLVALRTYRARA